MIVCTKNCMLASSKSIHCFSSLSRKLDVGWPIIEFQLRGHSCVNNLQHCLCNWYTQMRHSKQTATLLLLLTFLWSSALSPKQQACMWVTFWEVKGLKCSSVHALFPNCKQLMQAEKWWGGRNNDYLDEPNCRTNGSPGSIISYTHKTKIETSSCISIVNDGISIIEVLWNQ